MKIVLYCVLCAAAGAAAYGILRRGTKAAAPLTGLVFVLPFAAGGFYDYTSAAVSVFLLWFLWRRARENGGKLTLCLNLPALAVPAVFAGYALSFLWGADHGLAAWGGVRYLPVLLYALALMNLPAGERGETLRLVPLCGAAMTVLSWLCGLIPALADTVTVAGRLAGFFEYPNTFAAFLLAGLALSGTKETRGVPDFIIDGVLVFGITMSGSRTAFVLLAAAAAVLCLTRRKKEFIVPFVLAAACGVLLALLAQQLGAADEADRFLTTSESQSTFLGRFLYFKDALGQIARHPFGLGYMGYYCTQGSFQTGVYSVAFVHNGLLQLLLDIGWLPAAAAAAAAGIAFFRKGAGLRARLVLFVLLGHCMFDFDLQFLAVWLVLLPLLPIDEGKRVSLRPGKIGAAVSAAALAVCLWLTLGEGLYAAGAGDACLAVTPFYTEARVDRLKTLTDADTLREEAERVLRLDKYRSVAYSALANAEYTSGNVLPMIEAKEQAISCARYELGEYCDYLQKLYVVLQLYRQAGDTQSAALIEGIMADIPARLDTLREQTDPLAWRITDTPQLTLPDEYQALADEAAAAIG